MRRQNKFFSGLALAAFLLAPLSLRAEADGDFTPAQSMSNLRKSAVRIADLLDGMSARYQIIEWSLYGDFSRRSDWYHALKEVFLTVQGRFWLLKSPVNFLTSAKAISASLGGSVEPSRPLSSTRRGFNDGRSNPDISAQELQRGFAMLQDGYIHMLPAVFLTIERARQIYFYLDPDNGNRPSRPLSARDKSKLRDTLVALFDEAHKAMGWMAYLRTDEDLGGFFAETDWEVRYGRVYHFAQDPNEQANLDQQFVAATSPQTTEYLMPLYRNESVARRTRYNTFSDGSLIPSAPGYSRTYANPSPQASEQLDISTISPRIYASPQQASPQSEAPSAPSKRLIPGPKSTPQSPGKFAPAGDGVGPAPLDPSKTSAKVDIKDPSVNAYLQKCFDKRDDQNLDPAFRKAIADMLANLGVTERPPIVVPKSPKFVPAAPAPGSETPLAPEPGPNLTVPDTTPTTPVTPPIPEVNPGAGGATTPPTSLEPLPSGKPGGKPAGYSRPVRRLNLTKPAKASGEN